MFDMATETALADTLRQVARAEVLPRFRNLDAGDIATKTGPEDLVTIADRAAESRLTDAFMALFPDAQVVGEEAVSDDPAILGRLSAPGLAIVIDPIDGTANFVHGNATFGMIVALVEDGVTRFGILYDPVCDDWVVAQQGQGAWFVRGDLRRRLQVSETTDIARASGYLPLYLFPPPARPGLAALYPRMGQVQSLRCSCHEYRMLAMGHADFGVSHVSKPWDHAAGQLAMIEAGGVVAGLDGAAYDVTVPDAPLVAASNELLRHRVSTMMTAALR